MRELKLVEKFDAVLKILYDISGKRPTFGRIMALVRVRKLNIHWAEVWDIMGKMRREFLIHPEITDRTSKIPTEVIHLITFEGKLMYERKGLSGKLWRERFEKIWVTVVTMVTFLLSIGTFYFVSKGVTDDGVDRMNGTLKKYIPIQDSMIRLENNKIKIFQTLFDSVSKSPFMESSKHF